MKIKNLFSYTTWVFLTVSCTSASSAQECSSDTFQNLLRFTVQIIGESAECSAQDESQMLSKFDEVYFDLIKNDDAYRAELSGLGLNTSRFAEIPSYSIDKADAKTTNSEWGSPATQRTVKGFKIFQ